MSAIDKFLSSLGDDDQDDDELIKSLEEMVDAFRDTIKQAMSEIARDVVPDTYWKYKESEGVETLFRILEVKDNDVVVRAVRFGGSLYGPRVTLGPASTIAVETVALFTEQIEKTEYDEAMNKAFLLVDEVCRAERYHKE